MAIYMNRQFKRQIQLSLLMTDLFCLYCSSELLNIYSTKYIFHFFTNYNSLNWTSFSFYWILSSTITVLYAKKDILNYKYIFKKTLFTFLLFVVITGFLSNGYSGSITIINPIYVDLLPVFFVFIFINRLIYKSIIKSFLIKSTDNNVMILGYNETSVKLARYLTKESIGINLIGFAEDKKNVHTVSNYPIISNLENALSVAKNCNVKQIFSTISPNQNSIINEIIKQSDDACIRFRMVPDLSNLIGKPFNINFIHELPVLSFHNEAMEDIGNIYLKRVLDIFISVIVIVFILSWLVPLIGLLIKLESNGPIFFSQIRTGKNNQLFNCLKFRSMNLNSEADTIQASKNDNRVTTIGKFLRNSSIDEFPQFINVLLGDMSIVGPRPLMVKHTDDYSKIVDKYMVRHFLKPGITGWAQINGFRGEITNKSQITNRIRFDLWYLENWSIFLDVKIIFLTVWNLILKRQINAY